MSRRSAFCVFCPGLLRREGRYAKCVGIMRPEVYVDPIISGRPGEQALVAHEMCHAERMHGLQAVLSLVFMGTTMIAGLILAGDGKLGALWVLAALVVQAIFFVKQLAAFETEADAEALERTDHLQFIAFLYLHPHPKGRWARWKYGSTLDARIRRVLPQ